MKSHTYPKPPMVTTTLKIPPEMLAALRALSCIETLRRGRRVTWAALVRDVVRDHLLAPNAGLVTLLPTTVNAPR